MNINDLNITNTKVEVKPGSSFEVVEYEANLDKNDIDNIINVVSKVIDVVSKDNINIKGSYNNINFDVIIDKELNISGVISINNIELNIYYVDGICYVAFNNIGIKGSISDILSFVQGLGFNLTDIEFDLNSLLNTINTSNNNIYLELLNLALDINIDSSIHINELNNNINLTISSITDSVNSVLDINYFDIANLMVFIPVIKDIMSNNTFNFVLSTSINNLNINANISVNKNLAIYAVIKISDYNIYLSLNKDILKIKFNDNVIETNLSDLTKLFSTKSDINITNILDSLYIDFVDNKLKVSFLINDLNIVLFVDENLNVSVDSISYNNISISEINVLTTINNDVVRNIEEDATINIDDLLVIKDNIMTLIETFNDTVNINLETKLVAETTEFKILANLNLSLENKVVEGTIKFITSQNLEHVVYISYKDNYLKLAYGNIGINVTIEELISLVQEALDSFNLDINSDSINLDLKTIINSIFIDVDNGVNVSLSLLNLGNITVNLNNNKLSISDISISNISLNNTNIEISKGSINNVMPENNYLNYEQLAMGIKMFKNIVELSSNEGLSFSINGIVNINNTDYLVEGNISIRFKDNVTFEAALNIANEHYVKLYRIVEDNNPVYYLIYDNLLTNVEGEANKTLNFKANESDLLELINTISQMINFDFSKIENGLDDIKDFNIVDVIDKVNFAEIIKYLNIDTLAKALSLSLNINNTANLDLAIILDDNMQLKNVEINNLEYSGLKLSNMIVTYTGIYNGNIVVPEYDYYDLSMLNPLIKTIFNTALLTDFDISGTFNVTATILGIPVNKNININAKVKRVDNSVYPEVYVSMTNIPIISPINNDFAYSFGDLAGTRNLEIYYKDRYVYLNRIDSIDNIFGPRTVKKQLKISDTEFINNILYYLLNYGIGFSDSIMEAIYEGITINPNMDLTNVVTGMGVVNENNYEIGLNLAEVTGNDLLGNMVLSLGTKLVEGESYLSQFKFSLDLPLASICNIKLTTNDLTLNNINETVNLDNLYEFVNSYSHEENVGYVDNGDGWEVDTAALPQSVLYLESIEEYALA